MKAAATIKHLANPVYRKFTKFTLKLTISELIVHTWMTTFT
jgi:hypothetical protein